MAVAQSDASSLLWVDLYAPRKLADLVGNTTQLNALKSRLDGWRKDRKPMLLCGPPGIGKTSAVHLLAKGLGYEVLEMNASMTRTTETVRRFMAEFVTDKTRDKGGARTKNVSLALIARRKHELPRFIVVDEADGMDGNSDRGGMKELIASARICSVPVVFIVNEEPTAPRVKPLATAFGPAIRFNKASRTDLDVLARRVLTAALCRAPTPDEYRSIATRAIEECAHLGDPRSVINRMQYLHQSAHVVVPPPTHLVSKSNDSPWIPDPNEGAYLADSSPFERVAVLLSDTRPNPPPPMDYRLAQCSVDSYLTGAMVWESYARQDSGMVHDNLGALAKASANFSDSDLVERAIAERQLFVLSDARDIIGPISACRLAACRRTFSPNPQYRAPRIQFPSLLGHISATNSNARLLRKLGGVLGMNSRDIIDGGGGAFLAKSILGHIQRGAMSEALEMMRAYGLTHESWTSLLKVTTVGAHQQQQQQHQQLDKETSKAWETYCKEAGLLEDMRMQRADDQAAEEHMARGEYGDTMMTHSETSGKRKRVM